MAFCEQSSVHKSMQIRLYLCVFEFQRSPPSRWLTDSTSSSASASSLHYICNSGSRLRDLKSCAIHTAVTVQTRYLILLSVLKRIHCGMGLFCLAFFASFCLILKVF